MSILIDKNTKVITQGITGKTGQFHTRMCRDYANGTELLRRRRQSEEGGRGLRGHPDLRDGARKRRRQHRRDGQRDLRAAAVRRRGDLTRRSTPGSTSSICITEGIPVRDMIEVARPHAQAEPQDAAARAELPGRDHARRDQDRHHAGPHPPARAASASCRARARSPTKRSAQLTELGLGQSTRGRHRRRPGQRPEAHRHPEALQRRSRTPTP